MLKTPHPPEGTKRVKYLEENVAAFYVKLSKEEVDELSETFHAQAVRSHISSPPLKLVGCDNR